MTAVLFHPDFSRGKDVRAKQPEQQDLSATDQPLLLTDAETRLKAERRWSRSLQSLLEDGTAGSSHTAETGYWARLELLQDVLAAVCEAVDAASGSLMLRDQETGEFDFALTHGATSALDSAAPRERRINDALLSWIASGESLLRDPGPPGPLREARTLGIQLPRLRGAWMAAPVRLDGSPMGVVNMWEKRGALSFDAADAAKLEVTCHLLGPVLGSLNQPDQS